jgi:hypothetical protein
LFIATFSVDENLFYKGVDKNKVHGARLHQTHSLSDPSAASAPLSSDTIPGSPSSTVDPKAASPPNQGKATTHDEHPPYPFDTGDSLLKLTKKHNVCITLLL